MIKPITRETVRSLPEGFRIYAQRYLSIEESFAASATLFGLPFKDGDPVSRGRAIRQRVDDLGKRGVLVDNDRKSLWINWISPSCVACRRGVGTETFLVTTRCPRKCFFCFNKNQANYELDLARANDIAAELERRAAEGAHYEHLAVTGGEPMLCEKQTLAFLERARELYPSARTRLYTSGEAMDERSLERIGASGLSEVRFSVKLDEGPGSVAETLQKIEVARRYVDFVMVEMPVMPDGVDEMKRLLVRFDELGVSGINLLELCFPFHNASEFNRRGYKVKRPAYRVLYDYWYAGGLPIAGSEEACLDLLEFALDEGLAMGVHYCSLENKLTGQVFQQNAPFANEWPLHALSSTDCFLKSAKVFGEEAEMARRVLQRADVPFELNKELGYLEFRLADVPLLVEDAPLLPVAASTCIVEQREEGQVLRELTLGLTDPTSFEPELDL